MHENDPREITPEQSGSIPSETDLRRREALDTEEDQPERAARGHDVMGGPDVDPPDPMGSRQAQPDETIGDDLEHFER